MPLEFYGTFSVSVARMGAHLIADAASDLNAEFDRVFVWSDRASSFPRHYLWNFYSHSSLSYRIRYCSFILLRHIGQVLRSIENVLFGPHCGVHRDGGLRHQPVGLRGRHLLIQIADHQPEVAHESRRVS
jgi:hypothetical protein